VKAWNALFRPGEVPPPQSGANPPDVWKMQPSEGQGLPPELMAAIKIAMAIAFVVLSLIWLARAVRSRPGVTQDEGVVEERDSVTSWRALAASLLAWLRSLFLRLRDRPSQQVTPISSERSDAIGDPPEVRTVREVYRELLRRGSALGVMRARSATPYEHALRLQTLLHPADEVAGLTEAYVRARYGAEAPTEAEVRAARDRLDRIAPRAETLPVDHQASQG
jgi:hypothetical protein